MMLPPELEILLAVFTSVLASSGLWAWVQRRSEKKSAVTKMVMGLAHERIVTAGTKFIRRGNISHEEYDDFVTYLYQPYEDLGGNGLAQKIAKQVETLPLPESERDKNGSNQY